MTSLLESGFPWLREQLATQAPRAAVSLTYTPPQCSAFSLDCILGDQAGGMEYSTGTGDYQKVVRVPARVRTSAIIAAGVSALQRMATATIDDVVWAIDMPKSTWGPELVTLGLIRREINRHEEMESRGAV